MFKILSAVALSGALAATAAPALAQSRNVHVSYADLNLASAAGAAEFDRRIAQAVDSACRVSGDRTLTTALAAAHCRTVAHADALKQRDTALALARPGKMLASGR